MSASEGCSPQRTIVREATGPGLSRGGSWVYVSSVAADQGSERVLRVVGSGVAESDADQCVLRVRLRSRAEGTGHALTELAGLVTAVLEALAEEGLPPESIRTADMNVSDRREGPRDRLVGRTATYTMRVVVSGLERAGAIVSRIAAVAEDHLELQGCELAMSHPEALLAEARRLAVQDAKEGAGALAAAAGVTLGELLSIEETSSRGDAPRRKLARASSASARNARPIPPLPVEGGPLSVTSAVALVYRIL